MAVDIEIVTHCWAGDLPQYAGMLRYQISSLFNHVPRRSVRLTVCAAYKDKATLDVFRWGLTEGGPESLRLIAMSPAELGRRSIGRNMAALRTDAHVVWFADVDHYFGPGCLDDLWDNWWKLDVNPVLVWPSVIWIHKDHETGDDAWRMALEVDGLCPPPLKSDFKAKVYGRAIGGVQIVSGEYCRRHGYLDANRKYQTPREDGKLFGDFRDDVAFRKGCHEYGHCQALDVPNVFRLRHTATTYQ